MNSTMYVLFGEELYHVYPNKECNPLQIYKAFTAYQWLDEWAQENGIGLIFLNEPE